tara:strand:+ start:4250 stop:5344 length:1095 start_codon:yes stop_codon:yes gene_type:complete
MVEFTGITDPTFDENKKFSALDQFFLKFINDKRDLPFIYLSLKITFLLTPGFVILMSNVLHGWQWWVAAVVYLLVMLAYLMPPFTLMLHNTSHNPFYKKEYGFMNNYIPWFLGLFFGQSPKTYFGHHIGMHHAENNLPIDDSSTMKYQRDSFIDFMKYYWSFIFLGIIHLAQYFTFRKQPKNRTMVVRGELFYFALMIAFAYFFRVDAVLLLMFMPMMIIRFAMMAGNWGQHAFVDKRTPGSSFRNTISCINTPYNHLCFNDGHHIGHHLHPNQHWTDMPDNFVEEIPLMAEKKCIVFQKLDFSMVWFWLMLKRYDVLEANFVNLENKFSSSEDVITFLKSRLEKFTKEELEFARIDELSQKRR